jgi:hypothetical protein
MEIGESNENKIKKIPDIPFLGISSHASCFLHGREEGTCWFWVWAKNVSWSKKRRYSQGKRNQQSFGRHMELA